MKQNILYFLFITLHFVLSSNKSVGQLGSELQLTTPAPLSPNAASIQKFGDVPVGRYTGIPNIDIPIYNIKTTHLEVPVSLSYHASGVKIEDVASSVGLGWALNAGGVITRQVRGLPDEHAYGYLSTGSYIAQYPTMDSTELSNYYYDISHNMADPQPDLFSYNVGSLSGKFHFRGNTDNIVCIPQKKIKIKYENYSGQWGFLIVNTDGVKYYFSDIEETYSSIYSFGDEGTHMASSWYLTKIISADNKDSVTFEYETQSCVYNSIASMTYYIGAPSSDNFCNKTNEVQYSLNNILGKNIKKISFKNGNVKFVTDSAERQDLENAHSVKTIQVTNADSTFIKKINFHYSYTSATDTEFNPNDYPQKRMYLDSLVIQNGSENYQKYAMDYYTRANLPGRESYSQDFWGYYNGSYNPGIIPAGILTLSLISSEFPYYIIPFSGADRTARLNYAQCGTLKSLTYPTGGSTEFIYESNTASNFLQRVELGFDQIDTTLSDTLLGDPNGIITSYSKSFSIDRTFGRSGRTTASIRVGLPGADAWPPQPTSADAPDVRLIYPDNTSVPFLHNGGATLVPGNYQITADFSNNPDSNLIKNFYVIIDYNYGVTSRSNTQNIKVGGLRIAKILNHEGNNTYTRKFEYEDSTSSSGLLTDFPTFLNPIKSCKEAILCKYIAVSGIGHSALSNTQGHYVAYTKVTEYNSSNGELGKSVYHYSFWDDMGNFRMFPYPPPCSMDWLRGHLLKEEHFRNIEGNYELAKERIYNYDFSKATSDSFYTTTKGIKIGLKYLNCQYTNNLVGFYESLLTDTRTGWLRLKSDTSKEYIKEQPGYSIVTTNAYTYNPNNLEVDTIISSSSTGTPIKTVYRYPLDYALAGTPVGNRALAIKTLKDKNIIAPVLEKQLFRRKSGNDLLLNATYNLYNSSTLKPDTVLSLSTKSPLTNFSASTINNNALVIDSRYQPELIHYGFDANNNITGQRKNNDVLQTYLWDYNNSYVISSVIGGSYNDIAYTSFESDGTGNWTIGSSLRDTSYALTGRKSYVMSNGNLSRSNLNPSTQYWLTYWKKDTAPLTINGTLGIPQSIKTTNGWTCIVHKIEGVSSVTLSGSGIIDELRLYPRSAQMTTYTYDPLVGVTSQCDIRNSPSYYEYDKLGQLKVIRDQDKNILKTFEYKYKQPQ